MSADLISRREVPRRYPPIPSRLSDRRYAQHVTLPARLAGMTEADWIAERALAAAYDDGAVIVEEVA